jgi:hypothetical protein
MVNRMTPYERDIERFFEREAPGGLLRKIRRVFSKVPVRNIEEWPFRISEADGERTALSRQFVATLATDSRNPCNSFYMFEVSRPLRLEVATLATLTGTIARSLQLFTPYLAVSELCGSTGPDPRVDFLASGCTCSTVERDPKRNRARQ